MRKIPRFFVVLIVLIQALATAQPAQADGVIEFLFPSLRKQEYDPTKTLQAPFADQEAQEEKPLARGQLPENAVPLDQPHRVDEDIAKWLITVISESLTFTSENFSDDLVNTKKYFTPEGRKQYAEFIKSKGLLNVLQSKKFFIRNYVEDTPLTMNKGPVDGNFRWLFEVPVVLSYMDRSMTNYKEATPISQKVVLTVQVGRESSAENESGVLIERWDGRLQKIDKK